MDLPSLSTANGLLFPSRDQRFDQIVRALSEPDVGPGADNLMTNEDSFTRILGEIERKVAPGEVYIGVGPDQNFTYVAHARPSLAFLVDYRRRNLLLHLFHQALFALSKYRVAYLSRLTARRPDRVPAEDATAEALVSAFENVPMDRAMLEATTVEVVRFLRAGEPRGGRRMGRSGDDRREAGGARMNARFLALPIYPTLGRLIVTGGHMLASESLYQRVRERQLAERIIPIVGDLAGTDGDARAGGMVAETTAAGGDDLSVRRRVLPACATESSRRSSKNCNAFPGPKGRCWRGRPA